MGECDWLFFSSCMQMCCFRKKGIYKVVCMSRRATFLCSQSGSGSAKIYLFSVSFSGRRCGSDVKLAFCVVNLSLVSNYTHRFWEQGKVNCFVYWGQIKNSKIPKVSTFRKTNNFHKYCFCSSILVFAIVKAKKLNLLSASDLHKKWKVNSYLWRQVHPKFEASWDWKDTTKPKLYKIKNETQDKPGTLRSFITSKCK